MRRSAHIDLARLLMAWLGIRCCAQMDFARTYAARALEGLECTKQTNVAHKA